MWYANDAAVELWSAKSLDELLQRDFGSDMSESTKTRLDDYLSQFSYCQFLFYYNSMLNSIYT